MENGEGVGHDRPMLPVPKQRTREVRLPVSGRRGVAVLAVVIALGLVWRLSVLGFEGHHGDVLVMTRWAERMAEVGPWPFYEGSNSVYPALLYPLWALGAALDGPGLTLAVKGLSLPFDLGIAALLAGMLWRRSGPSEAITAAGLFLFNPAALLAGPIWGQVDSAGTLAFLACLLVLARGRHGPAGALGIVALMVKPQFGLVLLPVVAVAALRAGRLRAPRPVLHAFVGMGLAYVILAAPLALHPLRYLDILSSTATRQPFTSLNAFNPWGLFVGFQVPDEPYVLAGTVLLAIGCLAALTVLRRRLDLVTMLTVGALLVLAFYFLPTRVHERYLYPAIAVLAPLALAGRAELVAYLGLSVGFSASLLYALLTTTPFRLPEPVAGALTSPAGIWAIGLVLIVSALAWTWILAVRSPRLPRPRHARAP